MGGTGQKASTENEKLTGPMNVPVLEHKTVSAVIVTAVAE
jgi:hypothetical protein